MDVPFGEDFGGVMTWVRGRIARSYEPRFKSALDVRERDKLRHRMQMEVGSIANQLVHFNGQRTGYEASVVQNEFVVGAEESLLLFREGELYHYLFFSGGKLWKYARPMRPTDSFSTLVRRWTTDQGRTSAEELGGGVVTTATWTGAEHTLHLQNRRLVSASDLLVLESHTAAAGAGVSDRRQKAETTNTANSNSDDLDSFIE
jgi:hypothetical protein